MSKEGTTESRLGAATRLHCIEEGRGVAQDYGDAARWFHRDRTAPSTRGTKRENYVPYFTERHTGWRSARWGRETVNGGHTSSTAAPRPWRCGCRREPATRARFISADAVRRQGITALQDRGRRRLQELQQERFERGEVTVFDPLTIAPGVDRRGDRSLAGRRHRRRHSARGRARRARHARPAQRPDCRRADRRERRRNAHDVADARRGRLGHRSTAVPCFSEAADRSLRKRTPLTGAAPAGYAPEQSGPPAGLLGLGACVFRPKIDHRFRSKIDHPSALSGAGRPAGRETFLLLQEGRTPANRRLSMRKIREVLRLYSPRH